jgi:hypothetical protein
MEYCSRQCIRRTFYAVIIGTSPIIICLLLIALARLILNRLETIYYRRQKVSDRRRSSSVYHQVGRSILSYTPISTTELQRIIQGKQATESLSTSPKSDSSSPKTSNDVNHHHQHQQILLPILLYVVMLLLQLHWQHYWCQF